MITNNNNIQPAWLAAAEHTGALGRGRGTRHALPPRKLHAARAGGVGGAAVRHPARGALCAGPRLRAGLARPARRAAAAASASEQVSNSCQTKAFLRKVTLRLNRVTLRR